MPLSERQPDFSAGQPPNTAEASPTGTAPPSFADEPTRASGSRGFPVAGDGHKLESALIEGYELHAEIHRGGQGVVYRATQLGTKQQVAIKVLLEGPFAGEMARRRFEREVELAASLRHPGIVTILDSGISHGRYFFAMEFIDGLRLDRYVDQTRLSLRGTLELIEKVCFAVNFAHQRGVIHRDLKPSNILVVEEGTEGSRAQGGKGRGEEPASFPAAPRSTGPAVPQPKILDFGLAKPVQQANSDQTTVAMLSMTGQVLGTLAYMSPEQAAGAQDVDVRSDVYSLGVVLYEALLGRAPYETTGTLAEVVQRIIHEEPIPPRSLRGRSRFGRQIDDELETILLKALDKDPGRRYQTAGDLARDLRHYLNGEPIEAKRASGLYMLRKTLKRYRVQAAAAAIILVMVLASLLGFAVLYTREKTARTQAFEEAQRAAAAETQERAARQEANDNFRKALTAAEELRHAMVRQKIQNGELAEARGDLAEARDYFWKAYDEAEEPAALWALRQYYMRTGDLRDRVLYWQNYGPTRLSPRGRLAAICDAPESVAVCDLETGQAIAWVRTPGEVATLSVSENGELAAAGPRWARLWRADSGRPVAAADLPEGFKPLAVQSLDQGRWLLIVGLETVLCYRAADGALVDTLKIPGRSISTADGAPKQDQLILLTAASVERIRVGSEGKLRSEPVWTTRGRPPQAARFLEDGRLALLSDSFQIGTFADESEPQWSRPLKLDEPWDFFDCKSDASLFVLGARDGRVAVYHNNKSEKSWRVGRSGLEDLRLAANDEVVTLDGRGAVTHWAAHLRQEDRRQLSNRPLAAWAVSDDNSAALLMDMAGGLYSYVPGRSEPLLQWIQPRQQFWGADRDELNMSVALSGDGSRGVVRQGQRLRLLDLQKNTSSVLRWTHPRLPVLQDVALSHDGRVLACLVQAAKGDQQAVLFCRAEPADARSRTPGLDVRTLLASPVNFVGSSVRQIAFVPRSPRLAVSRSNGELVLLDAPAADAPSVPPLDAGMSAPAPTATLESPAVFFTFDHTSRQLAAACEDGVIRLFSLDDPARIRRLNAGLAVVSLRLDADRNGLLVRAKNGNVALYELNTLEPVAQWLQPSKSRTPLAAWIGNTDSILMDSLTGVFAYRYEAVDHLIEQNRSFARQRQIDRLLTDGDFAAAWEEARRFRLDNPVLGRDAQEMVVEIALRRTIPIPGALDWARSLLTDATSQTDLRLGNAAYDGGRFAEAGRWLAQGRAKQPNSETDAYTAWRIAECRYLADEFEAAATELAAVIERPDLDAMEIPKIQLELAAALLLAGHESEARTAVLQIGQHARSTRRSDAAASISAVAIGRYILGIESEGWFASSFDGLLKTFADRSLLFREDVHFFAGELARRAGRKAEARAQYQRCLDLARDTWPANWARYRLAQLAQAS